MYSHTIHHPWWRLQLPIPFPTAYRVPPARGRESYRMCLVTKDRQVDKRRPGPAGVATTTWIFALEVVTIALLRQELREAEFHESNNDVGNTAMRRRWRQCIERRCWSLTGDHVYGIPRRGRYVGINRQVKRRQERTPLVPCLCNPLPHGVSTGAPLFCCVCVDVIPHPILRSLYSLRGERPPTRQASNVAVSHDSKCEPRSR
ncbi:hypothetical protein V8B97DRAFT_215594 [Scleroderma yunnanense]